MAYYNQLAPNMLEEEKSVDFYKKIIELELKMLLYTIMNVKKYPRI